MDLAEGHCNGIHDACVGHILGGVQRQVRTLSYRNDIDVHLLVFAQAGLVEHSSYTGPCVIITGGPTCSSSLVFVPAGVSFLFCVGVRNGS